MKKIFCMLGFNHLLTAKSIEKETDGFRYVKTCKCGKHIQKSVFLKEHEFYQQVDVDSDNFPIDRALSTK